jgi:SAM-dependent methyltransferase
MSDPIHNSVRDRYGRIAENAAESCCGPDAANCGCSSTLYDVTLLEGVPAEAVNLSLGCGDPVTIAGLRPGETVLDLGSGGGIDCFLAAQQVGPDGYVIGVDMTPAMLERANASKARLGLTNVAFRQGQIEALPVDDQSVDVVISNCVINLSPDKAAVFNEIFRVLRPGGRMSVSDIVTEGDFSPEQRADAASWAECVTGAIDINAYLGLMQAAGFVDSAVVDRVEAAERGIVFAHDAGAPRIYSARITARRPT